MNGFSKFASISVDRFSIPQSKLNVEQKTRSNPLNWSGQFSPQLVEAIIRYYGTSNDVVLDPFVGSGTVLLESARLGNRAIGSDINPSAYVLASTYKLATLSVRDRQAALSSVADILDRFTFSSSIAPSLFDIEDEQHSIDEFLRDSISDVEGVASILLRSFLLLLDQIGPGNGNEKRAKAWNRLSRHILAIPTTPESIEVFNSDARTLPIPESSADLVITSPPYINVLNYHQQYRRAVETLGYDPLHIAKSEIGSNRKFRSNRFLTLIQYCLDMAQVLNELNRVCRPDSNIVMVVGRESTIRGARIHNSAIVAEIAHCCCDMNLIARHERRFMNRFGRTIFEDILVLAANEDYPLPDLGKARQVARNALSDLLLTVDAEVQADIQSALTSIETIKPSPTIQ